MAYVPGTTAQMVGEMDAFPVEDADLFIVGFPKSGTNWMSIVLANLYDHWETTRTTSGHIVPDFSVPSRPESGLPGFESCLGVAPPRLMKTHLPYPYMPLAFREGRGRAIFIMRNPKDACDSLYANMQDALGQDCCSWEDHVDAYLCGETAFGPWLDSVVGWCKQTGNPRVLHLTFEGVQADQRRALERIVDFVGPVESTRFEKVLGAMDFEGMKRSGLDAEYQPGMTRRAGKIGGWKAHFSPEQSTRFDEELDRPLRELGIALVYEGPSEPADQRGK